ncbi:MAG: transposase [Bacteroidales bacterium]|nr:transposase [Bacteroidales bacterium]
MSRAYKFHDPEGIYFITFATVGWIDVFIRKEYKDRVLESLQFCQEHKGLNLHAWCIMSSHVHMIASAKKGFDLTGIIRDLKKFTARQLLKAIKENNEESRKEWMLALFKRAGELNSNNKIFQFWRQDNKPIELYSNAVMDQKLNYLHNNPVEAGIVENAEDYLYSSAKDYAGMQGLLQLELLE